MRRNQRKRRTTRKKNNRHHRLTVKKSPQNGEGYLSRTYKKMTKRLVEWFDFLEVFFLVARSSKQQPGWKSFAACQSTENRSEKESILIRAVFSDWLFGFEFSRAINNQLERHTDVNKASRVVSLLEPCKALLSICGTGLWCVIICFIGWWTPSVLIKTTVFFWQTSGWSSNKDGSGVCSCETSQAFQGL